MRALTISFLTYCLTVSSLWGQTANIDQLVSEGKDAMYRQEYGVAEEIFGRIIEEYPDSPVGYGMMSIVTWNKLLYAAANSTLHDYGAPNPYSSSEIHKTIEQESERFHEATDRLLAVCEGILEGNPENVEALYFQGLAYENLAAEAIVIIRSRSAAVSHGRKANGIHEEVLKLDPDFVDANVSIATYEFAVATLPWGIRVLLSPLRLFGFFSGDKDKAFELMETVGRLGKYRNLDAQILLSVMHAFKGDPLRAASILEEMGQLYPENYMIDLNLAAIQELRLRNPTAALATYQALEESLGEKTPGLGAGELQFRIGRTYYGLGEYDLAVEAFRKALDRPKGELETEPLTYFFLGQVREKQGLENEAVEYYRQFVSQADSMESLEDQIETVHRKLR